MTELDDLTIDEILHLTERDIEVLTIEAETEDTLVEMKGQVEDATNRLDLLMEHINSEMQFRSDHDRQ